MRVRIARLGLAGTSKCRAETQNRAHEQGGNHRYAGAAIGPPRRGTGPVSGRGRSAASAGDDARAAAELQELELSFGRGGRGVLDRLLPERPAADEWSHYPEGDAHDPATHAQYYFHVHPGAPGEFGHFHTFLRRRGQPESAAPLAGGAAGVAGAAHLVGVSVNRRGRPTHLFTTNAWVTGETVHGANDVIAMLARFVWRDDDPVGRWLSCLLRVHAPAIGDLLLRRDAVLQAHFRTRPPGEVLADRSLEVLSSVRIGAREKGRAD